MDCSQCRFWIFSSAGTSIHVEEAGQEHQWAQCRRNAPAVLPSDRRRVWPITRCDDWCGEFDPLQSETDS